MIYTYMISLKMTNIFIYLTIFDFIYMLVLGNISKKSIFYNLINMLI